MPDLNVVAIIKAKPGSEDVVGDALSALVEPTRAEEGCLAYDLFGSAIDTSTFITVERWTSQEALDGHMQSAHLQAALAAAGEYLAVAPDIHPLVPLA
jgi:quinol monooxygenase YgiN